MNRSTVIVLALAFLSVPALAQQPLEPGEAYAPQPQQYAQPQQQPQSPPPQYTPPQPQPIDPYAADEDDEEYGYDVTYDVSTEPEQQQYDDGSDPNAYQQFESQLAPYGSWEDVPSYGQVWMPSTNVVGADFSPYATGGHFVMSDYGWTWVSDWDWGWAPFHYGRWMVLGGRGWCWIPGTAWGPAWVDWRWGGGYVGWAPMAPRGVVIGPPRGVRGPWRFTVAAQLGSRNVAYLPSRVVPSVWSRTTVVHNAQNVNFGAASVRFNAGPPARAVAAATGRAVTPVALNQMGPRAAPRAGIAPRLNAPVQSRPWLQSRPIGGTFAHPVPGARTLGAASGPRPLPLQSAAARPAYNQAYAQPRPVYSQPYRAPAYSAPTYRAPAYSAPAYHAPSYAAPTYRAPAYSAPVYRAPVYSAPAYHSAPSYSAPSYSAPTFHSAPSYSAPSYSAPSYHSAPSYSAPSYSAPSYHSSGGISGAAHSSGGFHGGGGHR
jgi:hypothetical protein